MTASRVSQGGPLGRLASSPSAGFLWWTPRPGPIGGSNLACVRITRAGALSILINRGDGLENELSVPMDSIRPELWSVAVCRVCGRAPAADFIASINKGADAPREPGWSVLESASKAEAAGPPPGKE